MNMHVRKNLPLVGLCYATTLVAFLGACAPAVSAQVFFGEHAGFVLPLVTRSGGHTTTISDNFSMAFPVGVTVKNAGPWAFDMELVASVQQRPRVVNLTFHPGVIYGLPHGFAVGTRVAFVANSATVGFTPLIAKSWPIKKEHSLAKAYFVEADVPFRFDRPTNATPSNATTFAMHFGLGF